jgi:REP element-mobilizing transposase RayT
MTELRFFNPYGDIRHTENRLPHWQQKGAVYFVTFRLADAIPSTLRADWERERETWLEFHPQPWCEKTEREYHERFSGQIERWLDAGYGSCALRRHGCARIIDEALLHFDNDRLGLVSSVVMPNHVHVLFVQNPEHPLEELVRSWKSYTTQQVNSLLARSGTLWQRDYFDRLIRDQQHFENCVRYIRRNPQKARLNCDDYLMYESEIARQID